MSDSQQKFLGCPELLENLLTMLDPLSVKRLTQSEVVEKKVLKRSLSSKIWAGLIKRSSYEGGGVLVLDDVKSAHFRTKKNGTSSGQIKILRPLL